MTRRSILLVIIAWPILAIVVGAFSYRFISEEAATSDPYDWANVTERTSREQAIRDDALESAISIGICVPTGIFAVIGLRMLVRKFSENFDFPTAAC